MKDFTKYIIIQFVALIVLSASCVKDKNDGIVADAIVRNSGDPAADGCGWLISIGSGNQTYKPENLPFEYRIDDLHIHITYKLLNTKYQCGMLPATSNSGITYIHINAIIKN